MKALYAGSRDHPLFNRMAGYWIEDYEASDFNRRVFLVKTTGDEWDEKTVKGHTDNVGARAANKTLSEQRR